MHKQTSIERSGAVRGELQTSIGYIEANDGRLLLRERSRTHTRHLDQCATHLNSISPLFASLRLSTLTIGPEAETHQPRNPPWRHISICSSTSRPEADTKPAGGVSHRIKDMFQLTGRRPTQSDLGSPHCGASALALPHCFQHQGTRSLVA
jgi:hypothetical protein